MIRFRRWLCLLSVSAVLCSSQGARAQCLCEGIPTERELSRLGLELSWWNQATLDPHQDETRHLTADEDGVYLQSRSGIITAFSAESGERLWSSLLGEANSPSYPAVTNEEQVLLAAGMSMFAINKQTGRREWQLTLPHHPSTSPGVDERKAYIGTLDGSLYAFDLRQIRKLYEEQLLPEWTNVATSWRYQAAQEITSTPLSNGRVVNFGSLDGSLYSVSVTNGRLQFQFETNGPIRTPVGFNADSLFVASDDGRFSCLNIENGKLRWSFVTGLPIRRSPRIVGPWVFLTPERGGMFCLNTDSGRRLWRNNEAVEFLGATRERVYGVDSLGNLLVMSPEDGAILARLCLRAFPVRVNNEETDRIFMASQRGLVIALKEVGSGFPVYHRNPERRPVLPELVPELTETDAGVENDGVGEGEVAPTMP